MSEPSASLLDRAFAITMAFLLPGLITLFGLATVNPTVQSWFAGAQNGPTFVGFLFVLSAALALNLVITALRWFIFENLRWPRLGCPWVAAAPSLPLARRKELEPQYLDLRHQHYYHYLAYANAAVAIPLAVLTWLVGAERFPSVLAIAGVLVAAVTATVVLGMAACDAVRMYDKRRLELLVPSDVPRVQREAS